MIRAVFYGLLCTFLVGATPVAHAAHPDRNVITVQWPGPPPPPPWAGPPGPPPPPPWAGPPGPPPGWPNPEWAAHQQHCEQLARHARRLRRRMERSPPWERDRIGTEFYQTQERLRIECGGW